MLSYHYMQLNLTHWAAAFKKKKKKIDMTLYINNDSLFNLNLIFFSFFERIFKVVSRREINTHILNYKIGEKKQTAPEQKTTTRLKVWTKRIFRLLTQISAWICLKLSGFSSRHRCCTATHCRKLVQRHLSAAFTLLLW